MGLAEKRALKEFQDKSFETIKKDIKDTLLRLASDSFSKSEIAKALSSVEFSNQEKKHIFLHEGYLRVSISANGPKASHFNAHELSELLNQLF